MRILLTAINAKYIHSNLAVYSLKGSVGVYEPMVELAEYTINHQIEEIFAGIYQRKPDLLLFSCYIWNRREVLEVSEALKKVLPEIKIWAGGPEVSHDALQFLEENPQFDGVMIGEGEQTFYHLLEYYVDGQGALEDIPGIAWSSSAVRKILEQGDVTEEFRSQNVQNVTEKFQDQKTQNENGEFRSQNVQNVTEEFQSQTAQNENGEFRNQNAQNETEEFQSQTAQNETEEFQGKKYHMTPPTSPMKTLDALPFVYEDLSGFENRILYYETSRGCPFSCSYCLSSVDKSVRYRSLSLVKKELQYFLDRKVKQVKFVDRTFNCSHERTLELWQFLRDHDNGITNFHCEISADLLNEAELQLLSELRPGLLQLEIGVQTVNAAALSAIHRTARFEKIASNVKRVSAGHNVHQHLDLIAGLPYEDFESFRHSFDTVYSLNPQELQLGFLKVLKGSEMHRRAEEYGIVYRSTPPYEVLQTKWISCSELLRLKEIEEMLEVYYNSLQYRNTIHAVAALFSRPIELYEALADYYKEQNLSGKAYSRVQRAEILRAFLHQKIEAVQSEKMEYTEAAQNEKMEYTEAAQSEKAEDETKRRKQFVDELLTLDLYLRENAKSRPAWAANQEAVKPAAIAFYQEEEKMHRYLTGEMAERSWKQLQRMTHLEVFHTLRRDGDFYEYADEEQELWLLFSYERRDPLTGDAATFEVQVHSEE